jgi:hypothetical protein
MADDYTVTGFYMAPVDALTDRERMNFRDRRPVAPGDLLILEGRSRWVFTPYHGATPY